MVRLYRNTEYMQTKVPFALHIGTWCFCLGKPQGEMGVRLEIFTPLHWWRLSTPRGLKRRRATNQ